MRTKPAFAGTYDFDADADFAALFPRFLDGFRTAAWSCAIPGLSTTNFSGSTR